MTGRGLILGGVGMGIAAAGACWFVRGAAADVPTAKVERGAFTDAVQIRGEIKAGRSVTIIAPSDAGELRIVKLVRSGTVVKKGDVLIEFDGSTVSRTVEEKQSELRGFEAETEKARSEAHAKQEEDLTAETKAGYDVERAKLDYSAKDILPRVDAEQRRLKVGDAQQKLREASSKLSSDRVGAAAKESGITTKRTKSQFDLDKAHRQLNSLSVSAPSDGIVTILRNWRSGNWMNPQDFKEGDRVWAGASIAELPDISSMFASGRVDEVERGRIAIGQTVTIRVEAIPDRELKGHVDKISALAKADFSSWPPPRNFDLSVAINDQEDRLRPGMTATIRVSVETLSNVLLVPPQALFSNGGEDVVYVVRHGRPERRHVEIDRRNADHVVVKSGLQEGESVALKDPTLLEARR
jgi:RND family efflux transporter MFP subunit